MSSRSSFNQLTKAQKSYIYFLIEDKYRNITKCNYLLLRDYYLRPFIMRINKITSVQELEAFEKLIHNPINCYFDEKKGLIYEKCYKCDGDGKCLICDGQKCSTCLDGNCVKCKGTKAFLKSDEITVAPVINKTTVYCTSCKGRGFCISCKGRVSNCLICISGDCNTCHGQGLITAN